MVSTQQKTTKRQPRRGAALLSCLFVILVVSSLVVNLLDTELLQFAETRNTIEYEQALYWANAGIHHACAELAADTSWRGTLTDGTLPPATYPAGYTVEATDDVSGVLVVATGYSGLGARTVEALINL